MTDVELHIQIGSGSSGQPLASAWLYERSGGAITRMRTDEHGHAFELNGDGDPEVVADYGQRRMVSHGDTVELTYSRGAQPLSDEALGRHTDVFVRTTVPRPTIAPSQGQVAISPGNLNALAPTTASVVTLPSLGVTLTGPNALEVWPVLWSLTDDAYLTDGLAQGAAVYAGTALTVTENAAAPAPSEAVRSKVRALHIQGTLTGSPTRVRVSLRDASGAAVALRADPTATADVQEVDATVSGGSFSANLLLSAPPDAFGEVELDVVAEDGSHSSLANQAGLLVGVQVALVDDHSANDNGQEPGPVRGEGDEVIIVDFQRSPQPNLDEITAQARVRRMIPYDIRTRDRPLSATVTTALEMPEMPMWMIELQLLGMTKGRLESFLQRRLTAGVGTANELRLAAQWTMTLSWDGPNVLGTRPYSYSLTLPSATPPTVHSVRLVIDAAGTLTGVDGGAVAGALTPAPAAAPSFPVAGRRSARVVVEGVQRPWGRGAGAPAVDATVIEFQPRLVDAQGNETMRGGDLVLTVHDIQVDGAPIPRGKDPSGSTFVDAPASPAARLPTARVRGVNPAPAHIDTMIDTLVQEFFDAHQGDDHVTALPLALWQVTLREIIRVESIQNHQFEHRGAGRYRYGGQRFGAEQDMPIFGAPAGYGLGQLDNPVVTDAQAWSYIDNIRGSVDLVMRRKARAAWNSMHTHFPATLADVDRAAFRREIVRRYNGNTEMRFQGGTWEIFPTPPEDRINYPNHVLNTEVPYTGPRSAVPFEQQHYGPGL